MSSTIDRTFVLVVGAPRSGTTWLHRMLAAHPAVAAMAEEELTVFSRYAGTWIRNYRNEESDIRDGRWRQGLPTVWKERDLDAFLQRFVDDVYGRVLAKNPTATHVLDKHPNYANHLHVADRYLPACKVIHLIRDGREVAVSMMSANERVGHSPGDVRTAAKEWHRCITNAHAYGAILGPQRYLEVRYEKLMSDTIAELHRILGFCGLSMDEAALRELAEAHHISRRQVSRGDTRNNELRSSPGAIWRERLSLTQRFAFDHIAGGLLARLGYATPGWWALHGAHRVMMLPYGLLVRIKRSFAVLGDIWKRPVEERLP